MGVDSPAIENLPDWALLARHCAGEATPDDEATLDRWAAEHPERRAWLTSLVDIWSATGQLPSFSGTELSLARAKARLGVSSPAPVISVIVRPQPSVRLWAREHSASWPVLAAGILMAAFLGTLAIWRMARPVGTQQFREFVSASGSRAIVVLRDGTRITLAPDTRLRVPETFGVSSRAVELIGEASFAVVHDARRPFAVQTQRTVVRDIGTTFVVRAYPEDASERVAVQEGEVALGAHAGAMSLLTAGDLATVADTIFMMQHGVDQTIMTAWLQGGLAFDETPLQEAVRDIARTFGVKITVADSLLAKKRITARFSHQALDVILDEVTQAIGARYEHTPKGIVIRNVDARALPHSDVRRMPRTIAQIGNNQG